MADPTDIQGGRKPKKTDIQGGRIIRFAAKILTIGFTIAILVIPVIPRFTDIQGGG
jgi:hypothetical protein